jgi:hypothetical protein
MASRKSGRKLIQGDIRKSLRPEIRVALASAEIANHVGPETVRKARQKIDYTN